MAKPPSTWKGLERFVCSFLQGERTHWAPEDGRIPFPGGDAAVEVKHGKQVPKWLIKAWKQAVENADDSTPLLAIHPYRWRRDNTLIVMPITVLKELLERLDDDLRGSERDSRD